MDNNFPKINWNDRPFFDGWTAEQEAEWHELFSRELATGSWKCVTYTTRDPVEILADMRERVEELEARREASRR